MTSAEIADRLRQALGSQYEIRREIGHGGMATVFLAEDLKHRRAVALKVLGAELAESLGAERFRREIATSAKLQHPHILTVLDSGETSDGLLWFTMPYVDGESLRARLERERQMPLEDAVGITREVALALDYAHANGVIHRDIKPENILLTRDRQALVADFGIARALTSPSGRETLTATGMSVGTPAYMSPEQAAGDRTVDARSDVYSLGAVCYEMLVGEPPFTGPTAQAILAKVLSGETPSVRRSRPAVPEGVDGAIQRALAPVPADRFSSATQLANALEASARAEPVGASLTGSRRMRPGVAFLGLGFLLGIGALFAWRARNGTPGAKVASLAVMPFANGDGDANTEYLSDGITESLIASLTHVPGLRVKSRSSVFHYKGKDVDIEKAGTVLGVPALVTGRVVPRGDSVEVSAELVEVRDNTELWGQRYGGKSADIITIEERIAGDLAVALRGSLTDSAKRQVTRQGTHDPEAYELYLRGRYAWNKRTLSDIRSSIAYFDQAIGKDPGYAEAYSGLADAYVVLPQYFDTSSDDIPKADAAARKALELDPLLAHPHAVLGVNDMEYHWDFPTGEAEFKRAFALDESDATAHQWYAECLALLGGREEEAIAESERARALDPLSPIISASGGDVLVRARRFDESVARLRTILAEYPTFAIAHEFLAEAYWGKRRYPEAIAGQTQYYVSGLSKYDNGSLLNTGYNKQSFRANLTQQFLSAVTVTANINYIHDVARRGITGNDNIGISPYDVFSYTPGFVNMQQQNADGTWPSNPFGPANPFADAAEISTPQQTSRTMGGGSLNWTPWKTDHQSLQLTAVGGMDLTSFSALLYAPPDLQVEQREPSGLPGTSVSNTDQINYFNYQLNLIHHYTGLSWLDATTSIGFERDRRTNTEPVNVGYNLLSGVNAPSAGTVQNSFFYNTKELDQSFYAQEQALLFNQRLTVTGGVTAERSTNDGNIDRFYYYPHYSAAFRLPGMPSFFDEVKLRAAYGQSGNLAPYGSKYTPLPPSFIAGNAAFASNQLLGDPNIKPESEVETELGFDATMLHSRAQFSATVYQKRLSSLLLQAGVAPSFGYLYAYTNGGQFTNQGIELSLQATPLQMRNGFTWNTTVSEFRNYSRVDALPVPPFGACSGGWCYGSFFAVSRSVTELVNTSFTGPSGLPVQNGDASAGFLTEVGNEFTFKGFRVHGLLDWSRGGNTSNSTDFYFDELGSHLAADSVRSAVHQAQVALGLNPFNQPASFLKVREVSVSYTLPARFVASFGGGRITNARLNLSGYNLWMITSYGGLDPEVSFAGNQAVRAAGEVTPYPPSRSVFLGLDLGF